MIKDSKIIGTKISAPFGWKTFKVWELFDFVRSDTPSLGSFVSDDTVSLITATSSNNGVDSVFKSYTGLCYKNILTIGMRGSFKVFLHTSAVVLGDNVSGFKLKDTTYSSSNRVLLFLGCLLEKLYSYGSGYEGYPTWSKLENHDALLIPVLSNFQPDFEWMDNYMKLVQEDYLKQKELSNQAEIKAYLTESHTDSLEITDADRQFLRDFEKLPRRKFKVGKLFDKQGPIVDRTVADFSIPYSDAYRSMDYINCATAGIDNNGCPLIVSRDVVDELYIMNNCITVSANGANTGSVFVQTEDFCVLQDSYALIFKRVDVNVYDYLFVASLLSKYSDIFDYQVKANWTRFSELIIELPVIDSSQLDVHSIEKYMQIQVKLTIVKRKERLDRELKLMKQLS